MLYQDQEQIIQQHHSMPLPFEEGTEPLQEEDESPVLACLRGGKYRTPGVSSSSTCSFSHQSTEDDDEDSLFSPLDPFDGQHDNIIENDSNFVDFALMISQDNASTDFASLSVNDLSDDGSLLNLENEEYTRRNNQHHPRTLRGGPVYQDPMASLNQSIASLNDAFEKLSACMERTAQSRDMLKQYSNAASSGTVTKNPRPVTLSRQNSNRSLSRLGNHRPSLERHDSSASLNSVGSSRSLGSTKSLGSFGRKPKSKKSSRSLKKRNLKDEISLRGGLVRRPMPQIILHPKKITEIKNEGGINL